MKKLVSLMLLLPLAGSASAVTMDWVAVGDPGNAADTEVMNDGTTGYGSVSYAYQIGRYEVTNAQYAEFLNSVAQTDPYQLYDPFMNRSLGVGEGSGIVQSGLPGSYSYSVDAGRENRPVNYVSVYDAMRFANWISNGQGGGSTETGAYTLMGGTPTPTNYLVTRNAGLGIFLPTEDEWYKAAYYDAVTTSYFDWPTGTNVPTACALPGATPNTANCNGSVPGDNLATGKAFTDVWAYTSSMSPYGTFDQGGNVYEYSETLTDNVPSAPDGGPPGPAIYRILRGTSYVDAQSDMAAYIRRSITADTNFAAQGFRIVQVVPEPGTAALVMAGLLAMARRRPGA